MDYPSLIGFPHLQACDVSRVTEDPNTAHLRRNSTLLDFGSYSCIRRMELQPYPIIKLAHPDPESRELIQNEYRMLKRWRQLKLPVPAISDEPIFEGDTLRGYRMEELYRMSHAEMKHRSEEIKSAVRKLHEAGYSHGDVSESNVMKDSQGRIVLIDVSFSGPVGEQVPHYFPTWAYEGAQFNTDRDIVRMKEFLP
jgi:serine/threonine protein kinase